MKRAAQDLLCNLSRERTRESASLDFFCEVVRHSVWIRNDRGVVGHDNSLGEWRHVPDREAKAQIEWKKRVTVEEIVFTQ